MNPKTASYPQITQINENFQVLTLSAQATYVHQERSETKKAANAAFLQFPTQAG